MLAAHALYLVLADNYVLERAAGLYHEHGRLPPPPLLLAAALDVRARVRLHPTSNILPFLSAACSRPCPGWRPQSVGHGAAFERMEAPEATAEYLVAMMSQTASSRTVGSLES
ncbi:hypothetical protein PR001_g4408 [Phytophthora rubi]|uniref:Uncharacterized protein n=1 Tax=Phytophthora rubi TaxID=129364 RepID=A0A6A3P130_9STRA|nr:hypothetical protein PR001_g4408 [Phytophthora rubi]